MVCKAFVLLFLLFPAVVARDVPLGECHMCEVTCFNDCVHKYDDEIMQAERREYEAKQRMLRAHGGGHISARGLAGVSLDDFMQTGDGETNRTHVFAWRTVDQSKKSQDELDLQRSERFTGCLRRKKCMGHPLRRSPKIPSGDCAEFSSPKSSLLALRSANQARCATADNSKCAMECLGEGVDGTESLVFEHDLPLQKRSLLQKRSYPLRPIRLGSFSKMGMSLDFCFKSCLAVTCGCLGAPGFDTIERLYNQIKKNGLAGEPIADTKAQFHYKPATKSECGGGAGKVTSKLYVRTAMASQGGGKDSGLGNSDGGWTEICTTAMMPAIFGPTYTDKMFTLDKCKSQLQEDKQFGCVWDHDSDQCIVGFMPVNIECNSKYMTDSTF